MKTVSVKSEPDVSVAALAESCAALARVLDIRDLLVSIHGGELSNVSTDTHTYLFVNGEYYELVEVGEIG